MASLASVTTMGYGISGGFTGDDNLLPSLGYGLGIVTEIPGGSVAKGWVFSPGGKVGAVYGGGSSKGVVFPPGVKRGEVLG